jgi:hypothetical protein
MDTDIDCVWRRCGREGQEEWNKGLGMMVGIYKKEDEALNHG